jgi:hypothetical protein
MADNRPGAFHSFYKLFFWFNLIVCTFGGVIISMGRPVVGGAIGVAVGFVLSSIGGHLARALFSIDENLKILVKLHGGTPAGEEIKPAGPVEDKASGHAKE